MSFLNTKLDEATRNPTKYATAPRHGLRIEHPLSPFSKLRLTPFMAREGPCGTVIHASEKKAHFE
jgi:hypothetical protein